VKTRAAIVLLLPFLFVLAPGCFGGYASDWAYKMVGLREVQKDFEGEGIIVAVIDTGFDKGHPSLDHAKIVAWRDFVENRAEPYDDVGHGTHVGGILVGSGGSFGGKVQGFDLKGAAPKADLIIVKAIRSDQKGDTADVIQGISFAVQNKADVICLSLGSKPAALNLFDNDMKVAIDSATNQGILVVASAGNVREGESSNDVVVPANQERVIAVGAVDEQKRVAEFSQRGNEQSNQGTVAGLGARQDPNKKPEIVAPGDKIRSAWINGDFAIASGTSQAAPIVCGALALLLEKCPALRANNTGNMVVDVKRKLMETAEPIAGQREPHDNAAGYGLLRADSLLDKYGPSC
jgi:subtilisin family serine protease